MEGKLTLHDVVAVGDETERDHQGEDGELPDWDGSLGRCGVAGRPAGVDDGPGTDGVADVVGAVGERGGASCKNLDERVGVLDFVGVLLGVSIDTGHAGALGSAGGTTLGGVDIVVKTVKGAADDVGGDSLGYDLHVVELVNLAGAHLVVAEGAQSLRGRSRRHEPPTSEGRRWPARRAAVRLRRDGLATDGSTG